MSGVFKLGGKTVATHDESTDVVSLASDVDISNLNISNNDFSNVDMSNMTFPAGHAIQIISAVNNTEHIPSNFYTNHEWNDTGTNATITPKYTSSQIFILARQSYFWQMPGSQGVGFRIFRDSMQITSENGFTTEYQDVGSTGQNRKHGYTTLIQMDSPNTTSPVKYSVYGAWWTSVPDGSQVLWQYGAGQSESRIILMEFMS